MKLFLSVTLTLFLLGCSDDKALTNTVDVQNSVAEKSQAAKNTADETTVKAVKEIEKATPQTTLSVKEVVATASGADLYKACASCHGQNAEKAALGKSLIIKGWEVSKIAAALHGYKDGTYGGAMKNLMIGQASKLSDEEIQTLSEHIFKL